jgi:hypothetical protein
MPHMPGTVGSLLALVEMCFFMALGADFSEAYELACKVVADHSGEPLRSVEVRVAKDGGERLAAELETASDGSFRAKNLAGGEYEISFAKPSYLATILRLQIPVAATAVTAGASRDGLKSAAAGSCIVRLVRYGAFSGQVVNGRGEPVRDGSVFLFRKERSANGSLRLFGGPVLLDGQGRYRVDGLPPGEYAIGLVYGTSVRSGGAGFLMYGQPDFFAISGGEEYRGVDFVVVPNSPCELSGTVELPEPGQRFAVALVPAMAPSVSVVRGQTDPAGRFHFGAVATGSYHLLVAGPVAAWGNPTALLGPEPLFALTQLDLIANRARDVLVGVNAGRPLRLILRADSQRRQDAPCAHTADVLLSPEEAWGAALDRRVRLRAGALQLVDHTSPGYYSLRILGLGGGCYGDAPPVVETTGRSSEDPIQISAVGAGSIRGRLSAVSEQAHTFAVLLIESDPFAGGQALRLAYVARDSHFVFPGLRPGGYRITAHPVLNGQVRWLRNIRQMLEIEVRGDSVTDLELVF